MTFSICVHESSEDDEGEEQDRFGVAVTTRLAGVGTLCPFVNEHGAVATQSLVNVSLGERGVEYLADGLAVEDALEALLNADPGRETRQLHGVDAEGTFAFSGDDCGDWFGDAEGENYTVAGNLLTGPEVLDAVATTYEAADPSDPLPARLVAALRAGHEAGGDKREELVVQSAALKVVDTGKTDPATAPYQHDLRVDASETPIADLHETYELAVRSHETAMELYEDAYEDDAMDEADGVE
ncbi:DUF1028 domain-containing protein [Halobacteriales archaeon QS_4_70_19]|nr:MAG: DUF1028 domain-containing protein [Halobacteriales archaeon QS_4_70_19]